MLSEQAQHGPNELNKSKAGSDIGQSARPKSVELARAESDVGRSADRVRWNPTCH